jgi:hypothetical protein
MRNVGEKLEPGASYIYERVGDTVYARKHGSSERTVVGYDYSIDNEHKENQLWYNIRAEAKNNPALQDAVDRVKLIYELSKQEKQVPHHPV